MKRKRQEGTKSVREASVAIGTWPTPEKPLSEEKLSTKGSSPRAIDTVPLPEKPLRPRKKAVKKGIKKKVSRKKK